MVTSYQNYVSAVRLAEDRTAALPRSSSSIPRGDRISRLGTDSPRECSTTSEPVLGDLGRSGARVAKQSHPINLNVEPIPVQVHDLTSHLGDQLGVDRTHACHTGWPTSPARSSHGTCIGTFGTEAYGGHLTQGHPPAVVRLERPKPFWQSCATLAPSFPCSRSNKLACSACKLDMDDHCRLCD